MLVTIIPVHSIESAAALMQQASRADVYELRLDYFPLIDIEKIKPLFTINQKKILLTLRKTEQGGVYKGSESERLKLIEQLITLKPDYLDIEHDVPLAYCQKLKAISPQTQLVCSYHNFIDTPKNLSDILAQMINPVFSVYKIITTAITIVDAVRVMHFIKDNAKTVNLVAHAMGELGSSSRILGKILGNYFTYSNINTDNIAPGLVTFDDFINIYHYHDLNVDTQIYGLIGDPVAQSIGHIFHNQAFIQRQENAVYVKFHVPPAELQAFFQAIIDLRIIGLSVTMPHKQTVLAFCNEQTEDVKAIGAANTLMKTNNGFLAANTDGEAVVQLLPSDLEAKKIVVLGAGGAAKSIIYSLEQKGAKLEIYNRTVYADAQKSLDDVIHADYDILINTIPAKFYNPNLIRFIPNKIILDANYQATPTQLIQDAQKHNCQCIEGQAMFYAQAKLQQKLWFNYDE